MDPKTLLGHVKDDEIVGEQSLRQTQLVFLDVGSASSDVRIHAFRMIKICPLTEIHRRKHLLTQGMLIPLDLKKTLSRAIS